MATVKSTDAGTATAKKTTSKRVAQRGEAVKIKQMGSLDGFHFTSGNKEDNTAFYIKINSKNNKALNLSTGKIVKFDQYDEGVPFDLAIGRAAAK